jgi:hypothetical protein
MGHFISTDSKTFALCYIHIVSTKLARAECVRCPWALLRNEVSTINGVFSLFSLLMLLFPRRGYRRVPKFFMGF